MIKKKLAKKMRQKAYPSLDSHEDWQYHQVLSISRFFDSDSLFNSYCSYWLCLFFVSGTMQSAGTGLVPRLDSNCGVFCCFIVIASLTYFQKQCVCEHAYLLFYRAGFHVFHFLCMEFIRAPNLPRFLFIAFDLIGIRLWN